jgi:hypothetical protein
MNDAGFPIVEVAKAFSEGNFLPKVSEILGEFGYAYSHTHATTAAKMKAGA